jgi:hypothetical protein
MGVRRVVVVVVRGMHGLVGLGSAGKDFAVE